MKWDSKQYLQYVSERTQPAVDLVRRIPLENPASALDVGCGPGNSTAIVKAQFPDARVLGIDNSEDMLARARTQYGAETEFQLCDITSGLSEIRPGFDIVFSNACLQWVPDHKRVLPALYELLNPGGVLAVQIPKNGDSPLYKAMDEVVAEAKWNFNAAEVAYNKSLPPEDYFDILSSLTDDFTLWESVYYHRMKSHAALVEWIKGTKLRPYLNLLDEGCQKELENEIVQRVSSLYPVQENGEVIYRFRRLFFMAVKTNQEMERSDVLTVPRQ